MWSRFIISICIWICSATSSAATYYVYCEELGTKSWDWLIDSDGEYVKVAGTWTTLQIRTHATIRLMQISEQNYREFKQSCQQYFGQNWEPHPGMNIIDHWYLFMYQSQKNMQWKASRGHYSLLPH
tara:strand:- start:10406 stop:10783 length:378 start_codon:yes stop_codon:yes gene_type:complete